MLRKLKLKYLIRFYPKGWLRGHFDFLRESYGFEETTSPDLVIPQWLIRGIVYTNGRIVIVLSDDFRDRLFSTIIYEIQPDFKIPVSESCYYGLGEYLEAVGVSSEDVESYTDEIGIETCAVRSAFYLKQFAKEILLAPSLPRVARRWP